MPRPRFGSAFLLLMRFLPPSRVTSNPPLQNARIITLVYLLQHRYVYHEYTQHLQQSTFLEFAAYNLSEFTA
jgi:hypothetical protein